MDNRFRADSGADSSEPLRNMTKMISAPIDDYACVQAALTQLSQGQATLRSRLVEAFVCSTRDDLDALDRALLADDLARAHALSHRLKGACATAGAAGLALRLGLMAQAVQLDATAFAAVRAHLHELHALLGRPVTGAAP